MLMISQSNKKIFCFPFWKLLLSFLQGWMGLSGDWNIMRKILNINFYSEPLYWFVWYGCLCTYSVITLNIFHLFYTWIKSMEYLKKRCIKLIMVPFLDIRLTASRCEFFQMLFKYLTMLHRFTFMVFVKIKKPTE